MNDLLIFLLLFAAIAIGWLLGRRSSNPTSSSAELSSDYYKGLNYLLDGRPDGAIDTFIEALEVNSETLETHLALGNLLRKRGEVERAIRVHQNLLARPSLPRGQIHQAHLELAKDYISAGLLDRAESLLLSLVDESAEQREASRRYLLEIYQSEREWRRAIEIATDLLPRKTLLGGSASGLDDERGRQLIVARAHYYCELAELKLNEGEFQEARDLLEKALVQDKRCVRASIMLANVEYETGHFKRAIRALRKVRHQDPDFLPETIALLRKCYAEIGDERALKAYLEECLGSDPSPNLLLAVAEDICEAGGKGAAAEFLSSRLADQPSLRGLARLIHLQLADAEGPAKDNLDLLQVLVARLVTERPLYRCEHCGFSGQQLHWFCPGCKYWGAMKTIKNGDSK
ncbi:MAG: lipopolysaccharide assembly protein LapB [Halioglobus sp.]